MLPGSKTHKVSSWLMHENAPKVEMPEALRRRIRQDEEGGGIKSCLKHNLSLLS